MSYKELLRKYIEHIVTIESVDYIHDRNGVDFTDKELEILHNLAGNTYITGTIKDSEMDTIDIPSEQGEYSILKQLQGCYPYYKIEHSGNNKYTLTPKEITP